MLSRSTGRKHLLDSNDIKKLHQGIQQNITSKQIQRALSAQTSYNKLTIHDINNLKYTTINKIDIKSVNGATLLIDHIQSQGFITEYRRDPILGNLDGLLFTNTFLLDRAKRFPGFVIIDATYNTNNLKMPLICAYGVSKLGK